jgi:predicted ATPase
VGENGTGKSTLLEAIAIAFGFNPEGGTKNFRFSSRERRFFSIIFKNMLH